MAEVTTIQVTKETAEYLKVLKEIYRYKTYEDLIRMIVRPLYGYPIDLSRTVPPGYKITRGENQFTILEDGMISRIFITIPPGSRNYVRIWVGIDKETILPRGWTAENPIGLTGEIVGKFFNVFWPVRRGQVVWAEIENRDGANEHTPTILVEFQNKLLPMAVKPEEVGLWRR